jgi:hypothetical protein
LDFRRALARRLTRNGVIVSESAYPFQVSNASPKRHVILQEAVLSSPAPVSLVWRGGAALNGTATVYGGDAAQPRSAFQTGLYQYPQSSPVSLDRTAMAQARDAARQEMLSGPVVERLADDVIRRIERQMRISRERRGA